MKADEARKITDRNLIELSTVLENINAVSHAGQDQHSIPFASDRLKSELLNLGYELRQHIDTLGIKHTIVSW